MVLQIILNCLIVWPMVVVWGMLAILEKYSAVGGELKLGYGKTYVLSAKKYQVQSPEPHIKIRKTAFWDSES